MIRKCILYQRIKEFTHFNREREVSIRIWSAVLLSVLLLCSCTDNSTGSIDKKQVNYGIQTNGIYEAPGENNGISSYARFYPDSNNSLTGTALCVSSYTGSVDKVKEWFHFENKEQYSFGDYSITRDSIYFSTGSSNGTVNYQGKILRDSLVLFYHSNINGHEATKHYFFHELD